MVFFLKVFFDLLLILLKIKKSNGKLRKFIIVKLNGWKEKTVMLPSKKELYKLTRLYY